MFLYSNGLQYVSVLSLVLFWGFSVFSCRTVVVAFVIVAFVVVAFVVVAVATAASVGAFSRLSLFPNSLLDKLKLDVGNVNLLGLKCAKK